MMCVTAPSSSMSHIQTPICRRPLQKPVSPFVPSFGAWRSSRGSRGLSSASHEHATSQSRFEVQGRPIWGPSQRRNSWPGNRLSLLMRVTVQQVEPRRRRSGPTQSAGADEVAVGAGGGDATEATRGGARTTAEAVGVASAAGAGAAHPMMSEAPSGASERPTICHPSSERRPLAPGSATRTRPPCSAARCELNPDRHVVRRARPRHRGELMARPLRPARKRGRGKHVIEAHAVLALGSVIEPLPGQRARCHAASRVDRTREEPARRRLRSLARTSPCHSHTRTAHALRAAPPPARRPRW